MQEAWNKRAEARLTKAQAAVAVAEKALADARAAELELADALKEGRSRLTTLKAKFAEEVGDPPQGVEEIVPDSPALTSEEL